MKFIVTIYKLREDFIGTLGANEYFARVTSLATAQTYRIPFGRIGIEDRQMETRLKQILEIILSG
jgi:hypothetical protein